MVRKRLLLLLKPIDAYPSPHELNFPSSNRSKVSQALQFLYDRVVVHKRSIKFCQNILGKKAIDSLVVCRSDLSGPIRDVDLVITIGGDGTLLHASHFMDDSIPLLGLNSDPTRPQEVEKYSDQFDAARSTGHLCAATTNNFEQILDGILENLYEPSELARMAVSLNSKPILTSALNDVLLAHPCPSIVSRFSYRITPQNERASSSLVHSRSSGFRVSTAAGSTAAMLSAGGSVMPILSKDLQYMVREPISLGPAPHMMHGFLKPDETMDVTWYCSEGLVYVDGSHVVHSIRHRDTIQISSGAPALKVYLPPHLLSHNV